MLKPELIGRIYYVGTKTVWIGRHSDAYMEALAKDDPQRYELFGSLRGYYEEVRDISSLLRAERITEAQAYLERLEREPTQ